MGKIGGRVAVGFVAALPVICLPLTYIIDGNVSPGSIVAATTAVIVELMILVPLHRGNERTEATVADLKAEIDGVRNHDFVDEFEKHLNDGL